MDWRLLKKDVKVSDGIVPQKNGHRESRGVI